MSADELTEAQRILQVVPDVIAGNDLAPVEDTTDERGHYAAVLRERMVSGSELFDMAPPSWLFPGVFRKATVAMLFGPSGSGKSFVAIGLAAAVMTGADWQGIAPKATGPVLYLCGEGASGVQLRMRAWADEYGFAADDVVRTFHTIPGGFPMHNEAWGAGVVELATELGAAVVIIDTLHTHIPGASDSEDKHMGPFVATCHNIAAATGALVLFVHHTNKGEQEYRGSTALYGNVDTVVRITGDPSTFATLEVQKQKDGAPADKWHSKFVPWGTDPETLGPLSLVAKVTTRPAGTMVDGDAKAAQLLDALASIATPEGVASSTWAKACQDVHGWGADAKGQPTTVLRQLLRILLADGRVVMVGKGKGTRYLPAPEPVQLTLDD